MAFGVASVACQTVADPATATSGPTSTPLPPTPKPQIQVISFDLSPGPAAGEWRVVGLIENQGRAAVGPVEMSVSLIDAAGKTLAETATFALMSNLLPGEASPFSVSLHAAIAPADARVEPKTYEAADGRPADGWRAHHLRADYRPELISELEEFYVTGSGELALLGTVTNPGRSHVSLDSLNFLGSGPDGTKKLVATMRFGPGRLAPGETAPFLALAPENPGSVQWTQYHDGLITEALSVSALEVRGDPLLSFTAQGAPFVVGTLANSGLTASFGTVLVSLLDENRLIGLWEVETPRPLQPGEELAFTAFGSPGVSPRFDQSDPSAVRVGTRVEEWPADDRRTSVTLSVDVSVYLSEGSAIFVRGTVQNPMEFAVDAATIYAEVRSSLGELLTAGWAVLETLEPDSAAEFVLDLPLPAGMDATLAEYDLRAIGLNAQP